MKRWMGVQCKRMWRMPGTWAFAAAALIMLLVFSHFFWRGNALAPVGIAGGEGACAEEVKKSCLSGGKAKQYRYYHDAKEMRSDVLSGRLDCAFILGDNLDEVMFNDTGETAITYLHTPSTHRGLVAKEEVLNAVFAAKSRDVLEKMAEDPKVFTERDDQLAPRLLERQAEYLDSDAIFQVIFDNEIKAADDSGSARAKAFSGRLMMALLLVAACALAMGRERFGEVFRHISVVMRPAERRSYLISYALAGAAPVLLVMLIALPVSLAGFGSGGQIALSLILLLAVWIITSLAAVGLSALVRSQTAYLYAMTIVLILFWMVMMLMRIVRG